MNRMPSAESIRRQVQQILASSHFDASTRNRKFLEFIVEETLAGNGDRLKGYTIALEVFDRDPSFDPQLDPVVRIEAGRLRRSLERYYLTEGKASAIAVSIPKGKYVPQFEVRSRFEMSDGPCDELTIVDDHISLIVTPVLDHYSGPQDATFDTALIEEVIIKLYDQHKEIEVIFPVTRSPDGVDGMLGAAPSNTEYILRGSVRRSEHDIRMIFHLVDAAGGHLLWTQSFNYEPASVDMVTTPQEIAAEIVDGVTAALRKVRHADACR
jgi:TolB-like protein